MSTCAKCGGHLFRLEEKEPSGSAVKVYFVQCTACGAPIGALDYFDNSSLIQGLEKKINQLTSSVNDLDYKLTVIAQRIRQ